MNKYGVDNLEGYVEQIDRVLGSNIQFEMRQYLIELKSEIDKISRNDYVVDTISLAYEAIKFYDNMKAELVDFNIPDDVASEILSLVFGGSGGDREDEKDSHTGQTTYERSEGSGISSKNINDMPKNVQNAHKGYSGNGWSGNYKGQIQPGVDKANAGSIYKNTDGKLPTGVTYKEFDVNTTPVGTGRGAERCVVGSDGSVYYTPDHYSSFIKIE